MVDSTSEKFKKIVTMALIFGSIGATLDIIAGILLLRSPHSTINWVPSILSYQGLKFSYINIIAALASILWISSNLMGKILSGLLTSILVIPMGAIVGFPLFFLIIAIFSVLGL